MCMPVGMAPDYHHDNNTRHSEVAISSIHRWERIQAGTQPEYRTRSENKTRQDIAEQMISPWFMVEFLKHKGGNRTDV